MRGKRITHPVRRMFEHGDPPPPPAHLTSHADRRLPVRPTPNAARPRPPIHSPFTSHPGRDLIPPPFPRIVRLESMRFLVIPLCVLAVLSSGCADELGSCDETTVMPAEADRVLGAKCLGCHSSLLTGDARAGAPAGLDFDSEGGRSKWADEMWAEIEAGRMPPPSPAGSGELSSAEKDAMRGWLACGASDPAIPDAGMCDDPAGCDDSWSSLWTDISGGAGCVTCHEVGGSLTDSAGDGVGFDVMGDACAVRDNLLGVAPTGPECPDADDYIVAGDSDGSLLVQKLRNDDGLCGGPMPQGRVLNDSRSDLVDRLVAWIDDGAEAPECD